MDTLVIYIDHSRDEADIEHNGRIFKTIQFSTKISADGFTVYVDSEGNLEGEELDSGVSVGAYDAEGTFTEYVFDRLDPRDVVFEDVVFE